MTGHGVDKDYGQFYVFDLQHARRVARLLIDNSYVRFGDNYFKQTKGIPMGINPAVFMANYYLFYYEFTFVEQLVDIIETCPPCYGVGACPYVDEMLNCSNPPSVTDPSLAEFYGDAALHLLLEKVVCICLDDVLAG